MKKQNSNKNLYSKIILFYIFFQFGFTSALAAPIIYFASFEEKTMNGKIVFSNLYINPVIKVLNSKPFKEYNWTITIAKKTTEKKIMSQAIKSFLVSHGNMYISSRSNKNHQGLKDTVNSYFQGYFANNVKIIKAEKQHDNKIKVSFKAQFAPVAAPDQWNYLILKNNFIEAFNEFKTFF